MHREHRGMRALTLSCLIAAALYAPSALAQATYTFAGEPFTYADPPYSVGDRVDGNIELAAALPPFMPLTDIAGLLLDFSFTDGVQTRIPANTDVCSFQIATDGAGNLSHWTIVLRQSPFPGAGNPVQNLDLIGPIPGPGFDQVGEGPAAASPCGTVANTFSANSSSAGSWTSAGVPPATPTVYTFTGEPFSYAAPPYALGGRITGSITLAGPLPPLLPMTDLSYALADFGFGDGIQGRVPANTDICTFDVATDAMGNISNWRIVLRQAPFPGAGNPVQNLDLVGPIPGPGFDQGGEGPAAANPCGTVSNTFSANSSSAGSWSSTSVPPSTPADYDYTGEPFTYADPPYALGGRVVGSITVAGALPPDLPLTDIRFALEDFSFTDGIQTRTASDSTVCNFEVATDGAGTITDWSIFVRQAPFPGPGNPVQSLDSYGPSAPPTYDLVGVGPAGAFPCDNVALSPYASTSGAGTWTTAQPAASPIPVLSAGGAALLVMLIGIVAVAVLRARPV